MVIDVYRNGGPTRSEGRPADAVADTLLHLDGGNCVVQDSECRVRSPFFEG